MNRATLTLIQVLSFFLVGTVAPTSLADEEGEATSPKGDFRITSETKSPPTDQDEGEISGLHDLNDNAASKKSCCISTLKPTIITITSRRTGTGSMDKPVTAPACQVDDCSSG